MRSHAAGAFQCPGESSAQESRPPGPQVLRRNANPFCSSRRGLDYFRDRISTLNPRIKKTRLGQLLETNLREVNRIVIKPFGTPIEKDEVKQVRELAKEVNRLIATGEEE